MTPEQQTAFRYPRFKAEETMHCRFAQRLPPHLDDVSVILTLNAGVEGAPYLRGKQLWHALVVYWIRTIRPHGQNQDIIR